MCGAPDKRIRVALDNGNASGERNFDVNDDDTDDELKVCRLTAMYSIAMMCGWTGRQTVE